MPAARSIVPLVAMPRKIEEIKDFLLTARQKDTKSIKIKKNKDMWSLKFAAADTFTPWSARTRRSRETEAVPAPGFGSEGTEMNLARWFELY